MPKIRKVKVKKIKCFESSHEKVKKPCDQFTAKLKDERKSMEITSKEKSKVILLYCPIVSRAGTDIESALKQLDSDKYAALIVLHQTFDPDGVVADSRRAVQREKTIVVDCVFNEDEGLLQCTRNKAAVKEVAEWLHKVKHTKI